jgi:hypothetical protein
MSAATARVPSRISEALEATGLPYAIEQGARHLKIKVAGRLVGIAPRRLSGECRHSELNVVSQIRRAASEIRSAMGGH